MNIRKRHTNCLEEESIIVKVILNERNCSFTLYPGPLDKYIKCSLSSVSYSKRNIRKSLTSSSKSRNATPLASLIASKLSAPFSMSLNPRLPCPSRSHPERPLVQGSDTKSLGIRISEIAATNKRSGNPSRFVSPIRIGSGMGGENVVSRIRIELEEDWKSEDIGIWTNACKIKEVIRTWSRHLRMSYIIVRTGTEIKAEIWICDAQVHRRPTHLLALLVHTRGR